MHLILFTPDFIPSIQGYDISLEGNIITFRDSCKTVYNFEADSDLWFKANLLELLIIKCDSKEIQWIVIGDKELQVLTTFGESVNDIKFPGLLHFFNEISKIIKVLKHEKNSKDIFIQLIQLLKKHVLHKIFLYPDHLQLLKQINDSQQNTIESIEKNIISKNNLFSNCRKDLLTWLQNFIAKKKIFEQPSLFLENISEDADQIIMGILEEFENPLKPFENEEGKSTEMFVHNLQQWLKIRTQSWSAYKSNKKQTIKETTESKVINLEYQLLWHNLNTNKQIVKELKHSFSRSKSINEAIQCFVFDLEKLLESKKQKLNTLPHETEDNNIPLLADKIYIQIGSMLCNKSSSFRKMSSKFISEFKQLCCDIETEIKEEINVNCDSNKNQPLNELSAENDDFMKKNNNLLMICGVNGNDVTSVEDNGEDFCFIAYKNCSIIQSKKRHSILVCDETKTEISQSSIQKNIRIQSNEDSKESITSSRDHSSICSDSSYVDNESLKTECKVGAIEGNDEKNEISLFNRKEKILQDDNLGFQKYVDFSYLLTDSSASNHSINLSDKNTNSHLDNQKTFQSEESQHNQEIVDECRSRGQSIVCENNELFSALESKLSSHIKEIYLKFKKYVNINRSEWNYYEFWIYYEPQIYPPIYTNIISLYATYFKSICEKLKELLLKFPKEYHLQNNLHIINFYCIDHNHCQDDEKLNVPCESFQKHFLPVYNKLAEAIQSTSLIKTRFLITEAYYILNKQILSHNEVIGADLLVSILEMVLLHFSPSENIDLFIRIKILNDFLYNFPPTIDQYTTTSFESIYEFYLQKLKITNFFFNTKK